MYYMEQGLVSPAIQENGYRDFSQEDVMRLQKISVLRNLGLSVAEIQKFLSHQEENVLNEIVQKKALEVTVLQEKQQLIEELDKTGDWQEIQKKLLGLQKKTVNFGTIKNNISWLLWKLYLCTFCTLSK